MKESDWKIFTQIKAKALETYCLNILRESNDLINDENNETDHEKYISLYNLIQKKDKKIARIFNGHSRSRAGFQLLAIRQEKLAEKELLLKLSAEFLESTDPDRFNLL